MTGHEVQRAGAACWLALVIDSSKEANRPVETGNDEDKGASVKPRNVQVSLRFEVPVTRLQ
jgi:hypothetical protein